MFIYDVRKYSMNECESAISALEREIEEGRDSSTYRRAILSLRARIAELNGNHVEWV